MEMWVLIMVPSLKVSIRRRMTILIAKETPRDNHHFYHPYKYQHINVNIYIYLIN